MRICWSWEMSNCFLDFLIFQIVSLELHPLQKIIEFFGCIFSAPKGSTQDRMDDTISPPVVALLRNQTGDNLLEDLSPVGGSSPGKHESQIC